MKESNMTTPSKDNERTVSDKKLLESHEAMHEFILSNAKERFPMESYRQLVDSGASPKEALEMLGYDPNDRSFAQQP
jgi:hypothetical protein